MKALADTQIKETEMTKEDNYTVLFVCTGNTCRSPMAQAVYNFFAKKHLQNTRAYSAGIFADGSKMSAHARTALIECGYIDENYEHTSVRINEEMCKSADVIVGLTSAHAMRLIMMFPTYATKIRSFENDIADPFGGYLERYKSCLKEIEDAVKSEFFEDEDNAT